MFGMFGKKELIVFIIGFVFAALITWVGWHSGFLFNASNFTFALGAFHVVIGLCACIRNIGVFRLYSYTAYKRAFRRHGNADPSAKPMSFAEYATEFSKNKASVKEYFVVGLPLVILSYVLAMAL